jgi:GT2 family glycosyltransferase
MDGLFFSVIIPTYQRPDLVARCLSKLLMQEIQDEVKYEIIVGDDSNCEETKQYLEEHFPDVRWVRSPGKGPASNRNHAASHAKGEWLIFIDDDTEPNPEFLKGYYEMASSGQYKVLEGKIICPDKRNSPFYRMPENLSGNIFASGNIAFHRLTFNALGRFDEDLVVMEDLELGNRIRTHKIPHAFCHKAAVNHRAQKIGCKYLLWWALHHRWMILYNYKRGAKTISTPLLRSVLQTTINHLLLMLRTSWHLFSQHDPETWKNRWFWQVWGWLCLPITLPSLWIAEVKFRQGMYQVGEHPT